MTHPQYAPDFQVRINDSPIPAAMRASITSMNLQTGLEGADRVELTLVNDRLRWLDNSLLALNQKLTLHLGYAPDPLDQVFVGRIVGLSPTFPSGGAPTLTVVAHDARSDLQRHFPVRWFAVPVKASRNFPVIDPVALGVVAAEHGLVPIPDPISATLSVLIGGAEIAINYNDPLGMQKVIRKQVAESDYQFLLRLAAENGWDIVIDHGPSSNGRHLMFLSQQSRVTPDVTLEYGLSLIDFTPRITTIGQVEAVSAKIWVPQIMTEFTATLSFDPDLNAVELSITPGIGLPQRLSETPAALQHQREKYGFIGEDDQKALSGMDQFSPKFSVLHIEEPVNQFNAARLLVATLLDRLNKRLTGSGSTIGNPRIRAGGVVQLEGVGEQFGGLYRITSATHTLDSGGYRTSFEVRKDFWFSAVSALEQGAIRRPIPKDQFGLL